MPSDIYESILLFKFSGNGGGALECDAPARILPVSNIASANRLPVQSLLKLLVLTILSIHLEIMKSKSMSFIWSVFLSNE